MSLEPYPQMAAARQRLFSAPVPDIPVAVATELKRAGLAERVRPGNRIAVTAGSRGITNIAPVLKAVVAELKILGAEPFLVPAMGSHGGATAEGQVELLAAFGITEPAMGAPIRSTMDVKEIGRTERDVPVYMDRYAAEADGIVVVNRVKGHTDFSGPVESGLQKMITIGLGKRAQAESVHAYGSWGLRELIPEVARAKIRLSPILMGLAILEDGYDQTCALVGVPADRIEAEEPALLLRAKEYAPGIPFDTLDLLIVDRIGKEISGCGMDTNVIGRKRIPGEPEFDRPRIERLIARDVTEESHGNAIGIGLADFITQRLHERIDWHVTNTNAMVSGFLSRSMVPVVCPTDQAAVDAALFTLRRKLPHEVRAMRISDTLHLEHLQISEVLLPEARAMAQIEIVGEPHPMRFDVAGRLVG